LQSHNAEKDDALIRAHLNGDPEALNQLIKRYYQYIFKILRHKGVSEPDAEDYTQNICLRLIESLDSFRFDCAFKTYLDRTINHQVIDHYRKKSRKMQDSLFTLVLAESGSEASLIDQISDPSAELPDQALDYGNLRRIVQLCLGLITNELTLNLVCLWLKGMKRRQMAELLNLKIGTVHGTLERGKAQLRECVKQRYWGEKSAEGVEQKA
jgi:RNA polymerase sigma-70 factor (ECF subfamily)